MYAALLPCVSQAFPILSDYGFPLVFLKRQHIYLLYWLRKAITHTFKHFQIISVSFKNPASTIFHLNIYSNCLIGYFLSWRKGAYGILTDSKVQALPVHMKIFLFP